MDAYQIFNSIKREDAIALADKCVVVYNMGHAIREVDEEGHSLPIGHYGVLAKMNPIVERLVEGGYLDLISTGNGTKAEAAPKKAAAPKKKTAVAKSGYNPDARDGDGDGLVQDGTEWERPAE
jgi:hypothetical protein